MSSNVEPKPKRRGRKILFALGVLLLLGIVLIAMAPTLVNWGLGQGTLRDLAERSINGTVALQRVRLGWFGPQSIQGIQVADAQGAPVAALDVTVSTGLIGPGSS